MSVRKVAVLGAGNGGMTATADLKARGFEVALYELPEYGATIEHLKARGHLTLKADGGVTPITPDLLTTDIAQAVSGAEVVLLTVPTTMIERFAEVAAPVIRKDQVILIATASCMCAVRFVKAARKAGVTTDFAICELSTLPYATRADAKTAEIDLFLRVRHMLCAAYPARRTAELIGACRELYAAIEPARDTWEATLANGNPEAHCACILNAGRIEYSNGEFYYYKEGITPHTVNINKQICAERLALGRAFGFELDDARVARVKRGYFNDTDEPLEVLFNTSPVFPFVKGPTSVTSRYFTEDITDGMVLYGSLGKAIGVPTPCADAIVTLGGFLLGRNFRAEGTSLEKLGLSGLDRDGLLAAVR